MIVCLAANPSVDRLFGVDRLTPGGIHRPTEFAQVAGGKGLNAARAASALGAEVRAVTLLGGHAGRWIAQQCEREGIELVAAWAQAESRSSLSVAGADQGLTEFYEHGAAITLDEWRGFAELAARDLPQAGWATISGSLPPGAPADGYVPLIRVARSAFDSREEGIAGRPALVKVNAAEAAQLTGMADALDAARTLHQAAGGAAIVTRGRDGAIMVAPDGSALDGSADAEGRYPVGSGDAFLAGLVVALDAGAGWGDALRAAIGAGAANAEQPGAGGLDPERARAIADSVRLSPAG
jgi:1-phosphofructokinase family hexose kinase